MAVALPDSLTIFLEFGRLTAGLLHEQTGSQAASLGARGDRARLGGHTATLIWLALVTVAVMTLVLGFLVYQLAAQQGRLLVRIEALESRQGVAAPAPSTNTRPQPSPPLGLPVGAAIENFTLKSIDGRLVGLADYAGARIFLIYWSPTCGFCDLIAPELAGLQDRLAGASLQTLLVSHGDLAANRAMAERYRLRLPILLLDGQNIRAFDQLGTPVAYFLDGSRVVTRPLAVGADAVAALAREIAGPARTRLPGEKPLTQSVVLRDGLPPGSTAPDFALPDLNGRIVSLGDLRGRRVLLVFSDPNCGPCMELLPELAAINRAYGDTGPAVVMVGRGDRDENRQKVAQHGVTFPVVVQEHWKLSKDYGIFATPVAFSIDENGTIDRPVAKGTDAILTLAKLAGERAKEPVA